MNSWSDRTSNIIRGSLLLLPSLFTASTWAEAPSELTEALSEPVETDAFPKQVKVEAPPKPVKAESLPEPVKAEALPEPVNPSPNKELPNADTPESLSTARQVVDKFQQSLVLVMQKAKELGYQGRYDQLQSVVEESHDLAGIVRIVVGGKQWKSFDEAQKKQLLTIFSRLAVATYAYNFNDYSGESFQFVSEKEAKRGRRLVRTLLTVPKGEDVRFDCVLKEVDGRWLIVNIIANGVSDLALKRSEYSSILGQQGFDGLLDKMNGKIEYYAGNKKSET